MSLEQELIDMIFEACEVKDHTRDELRRGDALIGPESPWGLDSLDSLEIVVAAGKKYGVRIDNQHTALQVLSSLDTLIEFIETHRTRK